MSCQVLFVTGTDTGVGKTVLACLLTRYLRERGVRVVGLKPVCSGGRADACRLWEAAGKVLPLKQVNPWHYRAPVAPVVAARTAGGNLERTGVVAHLRAVSHDFQAAVVEGVGGLLSPIGEGFDSRDLIVALRAAPVVVAPNQLGVVGQVRLVLAALPPACARRAVVALVSPDHPNRATRTNASLLGEFADAGRVVLIPHLADPFGAGLAGVLRRALGRLASALGQ